MSKVEEKREAFVARVAAALEKDIVPWRQPGLPGVPEQNAASGNRYSGLNALYLMEAAGMKGCADPRWLTSKEAEKHGLKVRAGEKGVSLEFWEKDGEGKEGKDGKDGKEGKSVARSYSVFNIQQFYNMERTAEAEKYQKPYYEKADEFLKKAGLEPPADGEKASYQRAIETLAASAAERSENLSLKNIQSQHLKALRTSIAGTFLMQEAGIPPDSPGEAQAQVKDWAKTLRLNHRELFRAVRDAVNLVKEVMSLTKNLEQSETRQEQTAEADRAEEGREFSPQVGQRVIFQPHEGKAKLTGKVIEVTEQSVIIQSGKLALTAHRDKGTFSEAPEPDKSATKEYAQERAREHAGERGNVYMAKGEEAVYNGLIAELTPAFALQKVNGDVILHRLKDLAASEGHSLVQEGQNLSITKEKRGCVVITDLGQEREEHSQQRSNEGYCR
jgi:antirestriction protein ArdC